MLLLAAFGIGNISIIFGGFVLHTEFFKVKLKTKKIGPPTTIHMHYYHELSQTTLSIEV